MCNSNYFKMNSETQHFPSLPNTNKPPDKAKNFTFSMAKPQASMHAPKKTVSYADTAKVKHIQRRFYRSLFKNTVRVDFSTFNDKSGEAKDAFGDAFEDIQPENNRKHPQKDAYEIVFNSPEDADKVFTKNIEFEGKKIVVQRGVDSSKMLQNVRILNIPINNKNRGDILVYLNEYFSKYGTVLDIQNQENKEEKKNFWQVPSMHVDMQLAMDKDFFEKQQEMEETVKINDQDCKVVFLGKKFVCFSCNKPGHIRRNCKSTVKRTRENRPVLTAKPVKILQKRIEIVDLIDQKIDDSEKIDNNTTNIQDEDPKIDVEMDDNCTKQSQKDTSKNFVYRLCTTKNKKGENCSKKYKYYDENTIPLCDAHLKIKNAGQEETSTLC
jgi:hypothetical protein